MDNEKEMLLKLLVEKYNQVEDCQEEGYNSLGCSRGSSGLGGSEYRVVEPEVWGITLGYTLYTFEGKDPSSYGARGEVAYTLLHAVTECTEVLLSKSSKHKLKYTITGGCPYKIAQILWDTKCAGVELVGDMTIQIEDYNKVKRNVSFNYVYG